MVAIKELCMRFPMVALHGPSMLLAVGCAPAPVAHTSGKSSRVPLHPLPGLPALPSGLQPSSFGSSAIALGLDVGEPLAVYDLETGSKRRALHFRYEVRRWL